MKALSLHELKEFIDTKQDHLISIFMPTHRKSNEAEQDPIRYKNILSSIKDELKSQGFRSSDIAKLTENAFKLLDDNEFWQYQSDGLAVFAGEDEFHYFQLPYQVEEFWMIGRHYYIVPLFPLYQYGENFYILSLSQNRIDLFEGSPFDINKIELETLPEGLADALKYDDPEKQFQFHTGAPSANGKRAAMFHGHGVGTDEAEHKKEILRYFQIIDKELKPFLQNENNYLVLSGVEYLLPIYKEANSYPHLLQKGVPGNLDEIGTQKLHQQAFDIVRPRLENKLDKVIEQYFELLKSEKASKDSETIVKASVEGRIQHLFIPRGLKKWGKYNQEQNSVEIDKEKTKENMELVNFAAIQNLLHNGNTFYLEGEKAPLQGTMAAVFRY